LALTTPNFSATESLGTPENVTLTDTSTGSDGTLTSRRVYFQLANGEYLVQEGTTTDYEVWPIADTTIELDILPRSEAVNVMVHWMVDTTIQYQKTILWGFVLFDRIFCFQRLMTLTSKPKLIDNVNYYNGMIRLITNLFCAEIAVEDGDDIYSAQEALDRNYKLIQNPIVFY
jgi:hypothetical protein